MHWRHPSALPQLFRIPIGVRALHPQLADDLRAFHGHPSPELCRVALHAGSLPPRRIRLHTDSRYVLLVGLPQISLAVVGIDFPNKRGPTRRFAIGLLRPGDPVELRPEPKNPADPRAIAVFTAEGVQIGYLTAERCGRIGQLLRQGCEAEAVFQRLDKAAAIIRVAFDGDVPDLPPEPCHTSEDVWMEPA